MHCYLIVSIEVQVKTPQINYQYKVGRIDCLLVAQELLGGLGGEAPQDIIKSLNRVNTQPKESPYATANNQSERSLFSAICFCEFASMNQRNVKFLYLQLLHVFLSISIVFEIKPINIIVLSKLSLKDKHLLFYKLIAAVLE